MTFNEFTYKAMAKLRGYWFVRIVQLPFLDYCRHYASYRHAIKYPPNRLKLKVQTTLQRVQIPVRA